MCNNYCYQRVCESSHLQKGGMLRYAYNFNQIMALGRELSAMKGIPQQSSHNLFKF